MTTQTLKFFPTQSTLDTVFRVLTATSFAVFLGLVIRRFLVNYEPAFLMLAIGEGLTVALVIMARSPMVRSMHPFDIAVTMSATFYFLLIP